MISFSLVVATAMMTVVMVMTLVRALAGPSLYDRILAINTFGTATVLFIALLGFRHPARPDFMDVALVYAMINFIATIAVLKFFQFGNLGHGAEDEA